MGEPVLIPKFDSWEAPTSPLKELHKEEHMDLNQLTRSFGEAQLIGLPTATDEERINDLPHLHLTGKRLNIVDLTPYEFTSFRTVDGKFEFYEAPF